MANDKDFIVKNAVEVGKDTKVTLGTINADTAVDSYNISTASYDNKSFAVAESTQPGKVFFKPDGTRMFIMGDSSGDSVYQYSLSTAWDISTASYDSVSFSVGSEDTNPRGLFFKTDGTKMYISGVSGDNIYQYSLSTAWDLSTASYDSVSFSVASQDVLPYQFYIKSDGTKLFLSGTSSDTIYQYSMSTAWDISSLSYDSVSLDVSSYYTYSGPTGIEFNSDGTKLFILQNDAVNVDEEVYSFTLSTAWNLSTASHDNVSFSVVSQDTNVNGLTFSADGTKMYVTGDTNNTVYQYSTGYIANQVDLSTGNYFNDTLTANTTYTISNAGSVQSFQLEVTGGADSSTTYKIDNISYDSKSLDVSSQETNASSVQFNSSGTKAFVLGYAGDDINQYSLSTAWDISTGSFDSVTFSVSSQQSTPTSFIFKSDGTKFYVLGYGTLAVHQYDLTSAFDLSTASYASKTFSISQDSTPVGLEFKPDGTKMYVVGLTNDTIYQYALSTAFDVSTASYESKSFSVASQQTGPREFKFNSDGTKFILCGDSSDFLYQYSCSTAYDISTASYDSVSYSINSIAPWSSTGSTTYGLTFKDDGSKLYLVDTTSTNDGVFQYSTGTDATITWPTSIEWAGSVAPAAPANGETDLFTISTDDGGTTYHGFKTADNLS